MTNNVNAYALPDYTPTPPGPPQRTLNNRAQRGQALAVPLPPPPQPMSNFGSGYNSIAAQQWGAPGMSHLPMGPMGQAVTPAPPRFNPNTANGAAKPYRNPTIGRPPGGGHTGGGQRAFDDTNPASPYEGFRSYAPDTMQAFADGGSVSYEGTGLDSMSDEDRQKLIVQATTPAAPAPAPWGGLAGLGGPTSAPTFEGPEGPRAPQNLREQGIASGAIRGDYSNLADPKHLLTAAETGLTAALGFQAPMLASTAIQGAAERLGAPEPVKDVAGFAPFVARGPASLLTKGAEALAGGVGQYGGTKLDEAAGTSGLGGPLGGPFALAGAIGGGKLGGAASEALPGLYKAAMPEPNVAVPGYGAGLPGGNDLRAQIKASIEAAQAEKAAGNKGMAGGGPTMSERIRAGADMPPAKAPAPTAYPNGEYSAAARAESPSSIRANVYGDVVTNTTPRVEPNPTLIQQTAAQGMERANAAAAPSMAPSRGDMGAFERPPSRPNVEAPTPNEGNAPEKAPISLPSPEVAQTGAAIAQSAGAPSTAIPQTAAQGMERASAAAAPSMMPSRGDMGAFEQRPSLPSQTPDAMEYLNAMVAGKEPAPPPRSGLPDFTPEQYAAANQRLGTPQGTGSEPGRRGPIPERPPSEEGQALADAVRERLNPTPTPDEALAKARADFTGNNAQTPLTPDEIAKLPDIGRLSPEQANGGPLTPEQQANAASVPATEPGIPLPESARAMTPDQMIATANRLNVPVDEGAITRGTELARMQEADKLQPALDSFRQQSAVGPRGSMGRAEDAVFNDLKGDAVKTEAQASSARQDAWKEQPATATGGAGGTAPPRSATESAGATGGGKGPGIMGYLQDLLYTPFGGDISSWLRQDVMRTLNPLRAKETGQVGQYVIKAQSSPEAYQQAMQELTSLPKTQAMGVKLHFADWSGDKPLMNREAMFSSWMNKIPGFARGNRSYAMDVNARRAIGMEQFLEANKKATPAQAQTYANYLERVTGRGSLGDLDKAASHLGPVFTSLRFAESIPQRASYLLPWTRLADGKTEMFGPVWREAVKDHAGFIATVAGTMALAQQAGLQVGNNPLQQSRDAKGNPGFGLIRIGNTDIDLTGGSRQYINTVMQLATGQKNGKDYPAVFGDGKYGYQGTVAEFLRNKLGPVPGAGFAATKATGADDKLGLQKELQFLRPDYWDQGVFGIKGDKGRVLDKLAAYVTPLWMQDVASAIRTAGSGNPVQAGAVAGAASFLGAGAQSYAPSAGAEALATHTQAAQDVLGNDQSLAKAFPNPDVANAVKGADYKDLLSGEKAAVLANASPDTKAKLDALAQDARDKGDPYQLRSDAYDQEHQNLTASQQSYLPAFEQLQQRLMSGQGDPHAVEQAISKLGAQQRAEQKAIRAETQDKVNAIIIPESKGTPAAKSDAQATLDAYRGLYDRTMARNGKQDYPKLEQAQKTFLSTLDPATRTRIEEATKVDNSNKAPVQTFFDNVVRPVADEYFKLTTAAAKNDYLAKNPHDEAILKVAGYGGGYPFIVHTAAAAEEIHRLSPSAPVQIRAR